MHVPQWLALLIAGAVILFGMFRLYLAFAGPSDDERAKFRRGMYRMPRWQHGLVGVLFMLVACALVATAFGWNPMTKTRPAPEDDDPNSIRLGPKIELPPAAGSR